MEPESIMDTSKLQVVDVQTSTIDDVVTPSIVSTELIKLTETAIKYGDASYSERTMHTYRYALTNWTAWCEHHGFCPMPCTADSIALFLADHAQQGYKITNIQIHLYAIKWAHTQMGYQIQGNPAVYKRVISGIKRTEPKATRLKQAQVIELEQIESAFCVEDETISDMRARMIVTLLYHTGFRAAELLSINIEDLSFTNRGLEIVLVKSKTSLDPITTYVSPYKKNPMICPVAATKRWLDFTGFTSGPLCIGLLTNGGIPGYTPAQIRKRDGQVMCVIDGPPSGRCKIERLTYAGLYKIIKSIFGEGYSCHSTRRGMITHLANKDVPVADIKTLSRHKSADMVLRYVQSRKGYDSSFTSLEKKKYD